MHLLLDGSATTEIDVACCHLLLLAACCRNELQSPSEWQSLLDYCQAGTLYEQLGSCREKVKQQLQVLLNSNNPRHVNGTTQRFSELFPSVAAWIWKQKQHHGNGALYAVLAHAESGIMLSTAAELIRSGIPAVTVHDSIIAADQLPAHAADMLCTKFESLGVVPRLKFSFLTKESKKSKEKQSY